MMRQLMIDSLITWAKDYKVDGFRFDLMGHHMLDDMKAVRTALDALTLEKDGVDGKSFPIGGGWDLERCHAAAKNALSSCRGLTSASSTIACGMPCAVAVVGLRNGVCDGLHTAQTARR
jgi:hypothetical protein